MTDEQRRSIDTANSRVERLIGWIDRVLPFHRSRPLDRIPSIKLKLSIVIGSAIIITILAISAGYWLDLHPGWGIALAVVVALGLVQILARGLTAPLREMMVAAEAMAQGDLDQRVTAAAADETGELARSFNSMASHIGDLEQQRRDLIANVGHELRTPIAALRGNIENLLDGVARDREATLSAMIRQADRLSGLVDQLMDLSRLEAGVAPLAARLMDLIPVVDEARQEAEHRAAGSAIRVSGPATLEMTGDPARIHQVLLNLFDNAVRHGPVGEPVTVTVAAVDGWARVAVEDRGPGIPAGELEAVFERFYRVGEDRATGSGGTGLGLAISRSIVELHGGSMRAENVDPSGCRISLRLPQAPPAGI